MKKPAGRKQRKTDAEKKAEEAKKAETEKRRQLRKTLSDAIKERIYHDAEYKAMTYRGFDILIPVQVSEGKPTVIIKREGRYTLEIGDTETGNLKRIDNFIDGLGNHLDDLEKGLAKLMERKTSVEKALAGREDYSDEIKKAEHKLSLIDKKIGLEKAS